MRYSSLLDGERFSKLLLAAADAALSGDATETREMLGRCFDALAESKDHFYPVDTFLFDLTLIAPSTTVAELAAELARPTSINLMITANDLVRLTTEDPSLIGTMTTAIEADRLCLVGGECDEQAPLGVLSSEQLLVELISGIAVYEQILGQRPYVFGRKEIRFASPITATAQQIRLHRGSASIARWDPLSGKLPWCDFLAEPGRDHSDRVWRECRSRAVDSESVLRLPRELGEAMDHDHVAAIGLRITRDMSATGISNCEESLLSVRCSEILSVSMRVSAMRN